MLFEQNMVVTFGDRDKKNGLVIHYNSAVKFQTNLFPIEHIASKNEFPNTQLTILNTLHVEGNKQRKKTAQLFLTFDYIKSYLQKFVIRSRLAEHKESQY